MWIYCWVCQQTSQIAPFTFSGCCDEKVVKVNVNWKPALVSEQLYVYQTILYLAKSLQMTEVYFSDSYFMEIPLCKYFRTHLLAVYIFFPSTEAKGF